MHDPCKYQKYFTRYLFTKLNSKVHNVAQIFYIFAKNTYTDKKKISTLHRVSISFQVWGV